MKIFVTLLIISIGCYSLYSQGSELNIRTCGIVPSDLNFMNGKLSDTWAQELIGSDLLKEELKEIPAPSSTNFITVMDDFIEGQEHGPQVRNLISGENPYAVLPELADRIHTVNWFKPREIKLAPGIYLAFRGELAYSNARVREGLKESFLNHSPSFINLSIATQENLCFWN